MLSSSSSSSLSLSLSSLLSSFFSSTLLLLVVIVQNNNNLETLYLLSQSESQPQPQPQPQSQSNNKPQQKKKRQQQTLLWFVLLTVIVVVQVTVLFSSLHSTVVVVNALPPTTPPHPPKLSSQHHLQNQQINTNQRIFSFPKSSHCQQKSTFTTTTTTATTTTMTGVKQRRTTEKSSSSSSSTTALSMTTNDNDNDNNGNNNSNHLSSSSFSFLSFFSFFAHHPNMMMVVANNIICNVYIPLNLLGFLISIFTKSHKHLDLIGTGAFALGAASVLLRGSNALPKHVYYSSWAILVWGTKLATFLGYRAFHLGHDGRLTTQLSTIRGMAEFWFITLFWNICTSLPFLLGTMNVNTINNNNNAKKATTTTTAAAMSALSSLPYYNSCIGFGGGLFLIGLCIETIADAQKWFFKQSHASNEFCNVGLWSMSQHPNFFGNLLLWCGILIMNLPSLVFSTSTTTKTAKVAFSFWKVPLAMMSPIFLAGLFYGQSTGMILDAVGLAQSKYGHDPKYQTYLETVPLIVPNLFQIMVSLFFSGRK